MQVKSRWLQYLSDREHKVFNVLWNIIFYFLKIITTDYAFMRKIIITPATTITTTIIIVIEILILQ